MGRVYSGTSRKVSKSQSLKDVQADHLCDFDTLRLCDSRLYTSARLSNPMKSLISYLASRPDATTFLLPSDLERSLRELFPRGEELLPQPYNIFPADETQPPTLGFPVADALVMKELE